jgi:hypothetical protein
LTLNVAEPLPPSYPVADAVALAVYAPRGASLERLSVKVTSPLDLVAAAPARSPSQPGFVKSQ